MGEPSAEDVARAALYGKQLEVDKLREAVAIARKALRWYSYTPGSRAGVAIEEIDRLLT